MELRTALITPGSIVSGLAFALTLAAAPALAAEAPPRPALPVPGCSTVLTQMPGVGGDPIRPTAESGGIPCPQFLSTTVIPRPRTPQKT